MSLFGKITKFVSRAAKKVAPLASAIPGPVGMIAKGVTAAGMLGGAATAGKAIATRAPAAIGRALPAIRTLPGAGTVGRVVETVGTAATGVAIYDAAGNLIGTQKKRRRINPMNYRALKRAMRRMKGARKIAKQIEKFSGGGARRRSCPPTRSKRC